MWPLGFLSFYLGKACPQLARYRSAPNRNNMCKLVQQNYFTLTINIILKEINSNDSAENCSLFTINAGVTAMQIF